MGSIPIRATTDYPTRQKLIDLGVVKVEILEEDEDSGQRQQSGYAIYFERDGVVIENCWVWDQMPEEQWQRIWNKCYGGSDRLIVVEIPKAIRKRIYEREHCNTDR